MENGENSERECHLFQHHLFQDVKHLKPTVRDIPLPVSQSAAVECHDKLVAAGAIIPLNKNIPNDATNSCPFLSVLITDLFVRRVEISGYLRWTPQSGMCQTNSPNRSYYAKSLQPPSKYAKDV